ncbi:MAG: hypothetical protein ABIS45_08555 [Burkholderiales bacterium]
MVAIVLGDGLIRFILGATKLMPDDLGCALTPAAREPEKGLMLHQIDPRFAVAAAGGRA